MLLGDEATEQATRENLVTSQFVHLAAHGLVDETSGNLFGAIALSSPAPNSASNPNHASDQPLKISDANDGFLTYNEIAELDLSRCRLVVLSACRTFDGPRRPMEAGTSLAHVFLSAGARSVIASHWNVDDESTAELMRTFYVSASAAKQAHRLAPSESLKLARIHLLQTVHWYQPWHWAPFVLSGR